MRTVNSFTSTAEEGASLAPRYDITIQREILRFDGGTFTSAGTSRTDIPQNYERTYTTSNRGWAAYKTTNGDINVKELTNMSVASNYTLNSGTLTSGQWNQRADILSTAAGEQVFFGIKNGSSIQIRYKDLNTNAYSDFAGLIPVDLVNGSNLVRRIEAVCVMRNTATIVILAVGTFNFTNKKATIEFWYVSTALTYQLDNIIQCDFTDDYTDWHNDNDWASFICAGLIGSDSIGVYANANPLGRGVFFTIKNGIESALNPIFPIDIEQLDTSFVPYDITLIKDLYYLTGRYKKTNSDDSVTGFDMYLTSDDGINWSIGERSSFLALPQYNGKLFALNPDTTIVYAGNNAIFAAPATPIQSDNSDQILDLTNDLQSWSLNQITNGADSANLTFAKNALWGDVSSFLSRRGLTAYLKSYQAGDTSVPNFAVLGLDSIQKETSLNGEKDYPLVGRDLASKKLSDWKASFDIWIDSISDIETDFSSDDVIQTKTPIRDIKTREKEVKKKEEKEVEFLKDIGLRYRGLNSPFVGFFDKPNMDGVMQARVKFTVADPNEKSASYFGFVFGASEDKNENVEGNMVLFPKKTSWSGAPLRPVLAEFYLNDIDPEDPTKVDTGLKNLAFRTNPLLVAKGDAAHERASLIDSSITYRLRKAYNAGNPLETMCEVDGDNDLLVRTFGRKVQYYMRHHASALEVSSDFAFFELLGEARFDNRKHMRPAKKNLGGIVIATDSYSSKDNFQQAQYGDIANSISEVSPMSPLGDYTLKIGTAFFTYSPGGSGSCSSVNLTSGLVALMPGGTIPDGWWIRLHHTSGGPVDAIFQVGSKSNSSMNSNFVATIMGGTSAANANVDIYVLGGTSDFYGYASSKPIMRNTVNDGPLVWDPKAIKRNNLIYGRGLIISEDNTAASDRFLRSDGVYHDILSFGTAGQAWDWATNPIPVGSLGHQGSSPNQWRVLINHGMFFEGFALTYDLPNIPFYFIVDDELIRAMQQSYVERGYQTEFTGLFVPTYYRPLKAIARFSSTLQGWRVPGGSPGDEFAGLSTAMKESMIAAGGSIEGMLVEIVARNRDDQEEELQYYAVDASYTGGEDYLTIDKPYNGGLLDLEGIAIVSGRGQFGTIKEKHDADAVVCYAPVDASGNFPQVIVPEFNYYNGNYFSSEDAIKRTCALAGLRDVSFRTLFTSGGDWSGTISVTPTVLPLINTLKNFDMKINCFIPGNNYATSPNYKLVIRFRSNYKLILQQWNDDTSITDGHYGNLLVGLATEDTDIPVCGSLSATRKYGAERWLTGIVVPINQNSMTGTVAGSAGSWTNANTQSIKKNLRVVVNENTLYVELEGQHVVTFRLDQLAKYHTSAGNISVAYDNAAISTTADIHIGELGDPVTGFAIKQNNTARSTLDELTKDRSILSRSTQNGGMLFSQFLTRDVIGDLTANLIKDTWSSNDSLLVGHILMAGKINGNYLDSEVLRTEGYKFDSLNNTLVQNTEQAIREAKLSLRKAQELVLQRSVSGYAKSKIQPEDKVSLVYTGITSEDYIVSAVTFNATKSSLKSDYTLRKFIS